MGIYKHPKTGILWERFRFQGVEYRRSTGTRDRATATVEGRRLRSEIEAAAPSREPGSLKVLAVKDISEHVSRGVDANYIYRLESKWAVVLRNFPRGIEIGDIGYDSVIDYVGRRRADGVKGQTIVREVQCLRRATEIARRRRIRTVPAFAWPKIKRDAQDVKQTGKLWSAEQVASFLQKLDGEARDETIFAVLTGLRAVELKRVRFDWIRKGDFGLEIVLPAKGTKGKRPRTIVLPKAAAAIVKRRRGLSPSELLFTGANHAKARANAATDLRFAHNLTLRDMRHTFASNALLYSGNLAAVRDALGHSDIRMTSRYISSTNKGLHEAALGAERGINAVGIPKTKKRKSTAKLERETRLELATFSLGSRRNSRTPEKSATRPTSKTPVIPDVCKPDRAHRTGSPKRSGK